MINTLSKTLEAQERIQDIKLSPSTKLETKPDIRSRRNELHRGDRTQPYEDRTRPISCSATASISSSDRTLRIQVTGCDDDTVHCHDNSSALTGRWRVIDRMEELQRLIESREVPERRQHDRMRPINSDRTQRRIRSTR